MLINTIHSYAGVGDVVGAGPFRQVNRRSTEEVITTIAVVAVG